MKQKIKNELLDKKNETFMNDANSYWLSKENNSIADLTLKRNLIAKKIIYYNLIGKISRENHGKKSKRKKKLE